MRKNTANDTAILIFAKSAKSESKRLSGSSRVNCNLISILNRNVESIAKKSNLPYFIIGENQQVGDSLGERLGNAFEHVYDLGFKHVIAIGNDCPTLTARDLKQAHSILQLGKTVVGPDTRGGIYLLGVSKSNFSTSLIQNSKWQHKSTFSQLQETFGTTHVLRTKDDLNDKKDFQTFLRKGYNYKLLRAFHEALNQNNRFDQFYSTKKLSITISNQTILRGPPAFLN